MIKLNNLLTKRFQELCEDVKNSQNDIDLNYAYGLAVGFASGLFLGNKIDWDCYNAMSDYIFNVYNEYYLGKHYEKERKNK